MLGPLMVFFCVILVMVSLFLLATIGVIRETYQHSQKTIGYYSGIFACCFVQVLTVCLIILTSLSAYYAPIGSKLYEIKDCVDPIYGTKYQYVLTDESRLVNIQTQFHCIADPKTQIYKETFDTEQKCYGLYWFGVIDRQLVPKQ